MTSTDLDLLRGTITVGALLGNMDGEIVTESDATGHAETNLVRTASCEFGLLSGDLQDDARAVHAGSCS